MEPILTPYSAVKAIPALSVLVLAPHPDDEVFGCGGTIAAHVRDGVPVQVVVMSDGGATADTDLRANESRQAALVLGCSEPMFWALPDRGIRYTDALVQRVVESARQCGADLVYAPSPWEVHPDHRQVCLVAMEAVQRLGYPVRLAFYEVGTPLRPNLLIDITAQVALKREAMQCFASQLKRQNYADHMAALNTYRTYTLPAQIEAAEAYWLVSAAELAQGIVTKMLTGVALGGLNDIAEKLAATTLPLISVLIRSMDRNHLAQTLDSVALQTYPHIEVVVVAARPDHRQLPERCGPFPLVLRQTKAPLQRSQAANQALEMARGDFLLLLDDDDWLMPSHVARLAHVLIQQPHALAAYTGVSQVSGDGSPAGTTFDLPFDPVRLLAGNLMPIHAVLFSSALVRMGCRFDDTLDRYEDWDFWLQLSRKTTFVHLPGVSAAYYIHDSSGVHDDAGPYGKATQEIYRKWASFWSPEQMGEIMDRVWAFSDQEQALHQSREQAKQNQEQAEKNREQWEQTLSLHQQTQQQQRLELAQQSATIEAMRNSRSWRFTRPLRALMERLRSREAGFLFRRYRRLRGILAAEGWHGIRFRLQQRRAWQKVQQLDYTTWVQEHDTPNRQTLDYMRDAVENWQHQPLISIVMPVYNPPLALLREAVQSIQMQVYPYWELCMADDASPDPQVWECLCAMARQDKRIKVVQRGINGHISRASNSALELASGEFVALMDNDDLLPPDALYWVAEAVNRQPTAQIIYSDEDKLDQQGLRFGAYFKPDWNYTLFLGQNLISHLGVYRTGLLRAVGGFRVGMEGSQDYDLALRCIERISESDIIHIPRVLYHWRAIEGSTALGTDAKPYALTAAQRALEEHRTRIGNPARVEILPTSNYRYERPAKDPSDRLTVVLVALSDRPREPGDGAWTAELLYGVDEVLHCGADAAAINTALHQAQGTLVALVRADLVPEGPQALLTLVAYAREANTGMASGTVRTDTGALVSGGLVLNASTVATPLHRGLPNAHNGYMGRGLLAQELNATSLDCVVMRKAVLQTHDGLDARLGRSLPGAVQWCLELRQQGLKIVWCPQASWRQQHSEQPLLRDQRMLQHYFMTRFGNRYNQWLRCDTAYHPLLDELSGDFSLLSMPPSRQKRTGRAS